MYVFIGRVQINCAYSTILAGSSFPHTDINIYNEGHTTAAINVAECDFDI